MSSIGPITPQGISPFSASQPALPKSAFAGEGVGAPGATGFGDVIDGLIGSVEAKQEAASAATKSVLLGDTGQLHQSVIAMQEASVAFTMMVEVRNKLVESYQELMRMQV